MASLIYIDNGIQFNNVNQLGSTVGSAPFSVRNNYTVSENRITSKRNNIINAIDIDWNGAVLQHADIENGTSLTINTTGDLLKVIDGMKEEIYTLAAAVIAIGNSVNSVNS